MLYGISLKRNKIIYIAAHFQAFDKAQVTLLGVMECVWLSEKTKIHSEISQPVCLLFNSGSFGQGEHFCGHGFVSLLWLQHIMQHRSHSQCEFAFLLGVCVHV